MGRINIVAGLCRYNTATEELPTDISLTDN